jgi:SET domain-containing protein
VRACVRPPPAQKPNAYALVLNHRGEPRVCMYAVRDVAPGEELLLRYNTDSDADFFAYACGLD